MDAVVESVISKVAQSVEENETLILGIKDQVGDLVSELKSFHVAYHYMVAGNENCNDNALLEDVVKKIEKVGTDAEDAIDKYLVERREHRGRGVLMKWGEKVSYYAKVNEAAKEMESIKKRAEKIGVDLAHSLQGGSLNNPQPPPPPPFLRLRLPLPIASPSSDFDDFPTLGYKDLFNSDEEIEDEDDDEGHYFFVSAISASQVSASLPFTIYDHKLELLPRDT